MRLKFCVSVVLALAAVIGATEVSAGPISYRLFQDGFTDGATLSGKITVDDIDGNGVVEGGFIFGSEVRDVAAFFSGNSLVPVTSFDLSDLFGFIWFPSRGPAIGDDLDSPTEGLAFGGLVVVYLSGYGPNGVPGGFLVDTFTGAQDSTLAIAQLSRIPEPGTVGLLGVGLVAICYRRLARARAFAADRSYPNKARCPAFPLAL